LGAILERLPDQTGFFIGLNVFEPGPLNREFGLELGFSGSGFGDATGQGVQHVTLFSARGFEDEVLLVAMALLLDAYMQWFHIGSYRLAGLFSQRRGLVHARARISFWRCFELLTSSDLLIPTPSFHLTSITCHFGLNRVLGKLS
jgi:hypothetical protein